MNCTLFVRCTLAQCFNLDIIPHINPAFTGFIVELVVWLLVKLSNVLSRVASSAYIMGVHLLLAGLLLLVLFLI